MRARSRFEGVSTPKNEWNRRLRTKTALEQQSSRTCTSKRDEGKKKTSPTWRERKNGVYVPITYMMQGKDGPRAKLTTMLRADTMSEAAKQRGESFTKIETGDARAISKPKNKRKREEKKKESGWGHKLTSDPEMLVP